MSSFLAFTKDTNDLNRHPCLYISCLLYSITRAASAGDAAKAFISFFTSATEK